MEQFEKDTGVKVVHEYLTSFPEMFTKLRTNPGYFDIVVMNTAWTLKAADEGLIQPIDKSKLTNFANLIPEMRDSDAVNRDGKLYGVPWIWGSTSISYNTEKFPTPPTSVNVLWDPKYAGRVCWHDSPEDSIGYAALALGQDSDEPADLEAIKAKLRELKPQIKTFWHSEDEWLKQVAAGDCDLSVIWTDSTEKAKELHNLPISFIVAEEGALAWRDALSIPTNPPNEETAYKFINYMTSPEFYAGWSKAGGAPVPASTQALNELSADSLTRTVLADPANIPRLRFKKAVPDETLSKYAELWEETKAFFGQ
jgi:spermidine/putrescine transport system substrate-binding protein